MSIHSQYPQQYMSQHGQPPFGPGTFSGSATGYNNTLPSYNEMALSSEHNNFGPSDLTQGYDQPQSAGYLRGFSGQIAQVENRMEGRFHEIRLRAESTANAIAKLENAQAYLRPTGKALDGSLATLEAKVQALQGSVVAIETSIKQLNIRLDELEGHAGERLDDDWETTCTIIDALTRVASKSLTGDELIKLQKYQKQGEVEIV